MFRKARLLSVCKGDQAVAWSVAEKALRLDRVDGSRSDDGLERGIQARKEISIAMKLLGENMGPVVWGVIGNSCSLRDHVSRQTGRKVNIHEAKGRLIAGLDLLARLTLTSVGDR